MQVKAIYRYPVKSLSGEELSEAGLEKGLGIPGDRAYGFALAGEDGAKDGKWRAKAAFHVLATKPELALINCSYDSGENALSLSFPNGSSATSSTSDKASAVDICKALGVFLGVSDSDAPVLVKADTVGFFDTLDGEISILNLASLRELEKAAGKEIDPMRFRANVIIDGAPPWDELSWAGKKATIGGASLAFTKPTGRCLATHANVKTGVRDLKTMHLLKDNFGHTQMGVYAHVKQNGKISLGDKLELSDI